MSTLDEEREALYGPLAPYSDYKRNERITYSNKGETSTGTVLWVATATIVDGHEVPCQYIVECDQHGGTPDVVMLGEIIVDP
jgi:hypothetical protein